MLTNMTYSRSDRCYRVTSRESGEVAEFPAGRDGRQAAFKLAVAVENACLYRLAQAAIREAPLVESRVWRACELVLADSVALVQDGEIVATVASNNEFGDYIVRRVSGQWHCECEDYASGFAPFDASGPRCKHTLAAELAAELADPS
jgi:hypothetical protein